MPIRTEEGWIEVYQKKDALWIHDGNPSRPHALLSSGMHSTGFFNSRLVIPDEALLREAASDLVDSVEMSCDIVWVDRVVGPETGATKLAEFISDEIGKRRGRPCAWASPAKTGDGRNKSMAFRDPDRMVLPGETILLCEDVLTTGGSVELTAKASINARGTVMPFVVALVNRSGFKFAGGKRLIVLIDRAMPAWVPEECQMCPESKPLFPKDPANWASLNATYPEKENI
ncbi:MAG: hypothetical protein Q8Q26_16395 [Pseudorhodobacter sp.]|nr:hypothetical protein [Pseudorhodobacter sp.]